GSVPHCLGRACSCTQLQRPGHTSSRAESTSSRPTKLHEAKRLFGCSQPSIQRAPSRALTSAALPSTRGTSRALPHGWKLLDESAFERALLTSALTRSLVEECFAKHLRA